MDIKNLQNNLSARANENLRVQDKINAKLENNQEANKAPSDRVTLTSMSSQIRDLERQASSASMDNKARIAELKQSIAEGRYQVNAEKVADKLIQTELLFSKV